MDDLHKDQYQFTFYDRVTLPLVWVVLGGISLITIDYRIGRFFSVSELPDELEDFVDAAEHFGTPYGQILALLCLFAATSWREWRVFRIFLGTCAAGMGANLVKMFVGRTRPRSFDFEQHELFDSFVGWFLLDSAGSKAQSFPSAHTASAFGFAALLTWAFPSGKRVFLLLACFVGLHRITTSAHFPSDVFIGAAVGWSVAILFTGNTWLAKKFDRLEKQVAKAEDVFEKEVATLQE